MLLGHRFRPCLRLLRDKLVVSRRAKSSRACESRSWWLHTRSGRPGSGSRRKRATCVMSCASVPQIGAPSSWIREGVWGEQGSRGGTIGWLLQRLAVQRKGEFLGRMGALRRAEMRLRQRRPGSGKRANSDESAGGGRWLMADGLTFADGLGARYSRVRHRSSRGSFRG